MDTRRWGALVLLSTCAAACRGRHPALPASPSPPAAQDVAAAVASAADAGVVLATRDDAGPRARDATTPSRSGSTVAADAGPPPPLVFAATPERPAPRAIGNPYDVATTAAGAVLAWSVFDERTRRSDLMGQALDPDGRPVGMPRLLRRTSGEVLALAVAARGDVAWVAWLAAPGDDVPDQPREGEGGGERVGVRLVAAMPVRADLTGAAAPTTLQHFMLRRAPQLFAHAAVAVAATDDGGALVVATGQTTRCVHTHDPAGRAVDHAWCAGWDETFLDRAGRVASTSHEATIAPADPPHSLVRVGAPPGATSFVYAVGNDHERSRTELRAPQLPGTTATLPPATVELLSHWVRTTVAWTGTALVTVGFDNRDVAAAPVRRVRVVQGDGAAVTRATRDTEHSELWPAVTGHSLLCEQGHPLVRVRWPGGSVDLDPTVPGAAMHFDELLPPGALGWPPAFSDDVTEGASWARPLVWAGRAVVGVDARSGQIRRWVCSPRSTLVPAR